MGRRLVRLDPLPPPLDAGPADTSVIPAEVERVLRALDERCARAQFNLGMDDPPEPHLKAQRDRLMAKADGVALARSYIADALRGVL